jgi:hypothetical protein
MKKLAMTTAAALAAPLVVSAGEAYSARVMSSFPGPYVNLRGLGRSNGYLHVLAYSAPNYYRAPSVIPP